MKWIKRGRQIGQAVKNVQRLRQIVGVFAKHGFADVIDRANLGKFLPTKIATYAEKESEKPIPVKLKECFEELGPTFVKLGQLLSTRPDLVPDAFIEELVKLQDDVQLLDYSEIKKAVERELNQPIEKAYQFFNPEPLAAASISQVHEALLHSGEKVVVKVQRPGIEETIKNDISLLAFVAKMLERYVPETRIIGPTVIVDEFFKTLSQELDFVIESNNIMKMGKNLAEIPEIAVPKVYKEYSSHRVLTLEKFEGIRVNDIEAIDRAGIDRKYIVKVGAKAFFKTVMIDGLFHGDLHGGNIFILPGNRLGLVDFGIVGRLSEKARDRLANMVMAIITEDYENLCYQYAELGAADPSIDFESFQREVRSAISPYLGLSMAEVNSGKVLIESTKIATKYNIRIPGDWMIVFKAILTIEGMGRSLDPEFDVMTLGQDLAKELVKNQYSVQRIRKDLLWIAKDVTALLQVLPRQIRWMFKKFNRDDFAFEIKAPQLEEIKTQLDANAKRTALSIISASLFIASAIALQFSDERLVGSYPLVSVVLFGMAFLLALRLVRK